MDDTANRHVFKVAWLYLRLVLTLNVVNFYLVSILKCSVVRTVVALYGPMPSNETCALFSSQQRTCGSKSIRRILLVVLFSHPSSGIHQTVTATSSTSHITYQGKDLLPAWPN